MSSFHQIQSTTFNQEIERIFSAIKYKNYTLSNEKKVQIQLLSHFKSAGLDAKREVHLSNDSIIDFMIGDIGIEVKVKGAAFGILKQCERYCEFDQVKCLLLISAKFIGFPEEINGKPCYFFSLSRSML